MRKKEKKKSSLAKKNLICFIMVFLLNNILLLLCIISVIRYGVYGFYRYKIVLIISCAVFALMMIVSIYYYFYIIIPYQETKNLLLSLNSVDELDSFDHFIFSGMDQIFWKVKKLINRDEAIELTKNQAQYLALQNQINPHFLYNTLEAIRSDALAEGVDDIAQAIEALATFFRYTITNVKNLVSLEESLSITENYFVIQRYRFGEKISMEIDYDKSDPATLQYMLPKLTLQPIIENAIIHGLEQKTTPGTILIKIQTTQSRLIINVIDDGLGMSMNMLDKLNKKIAMPFSLQENSVKMGGIALVNVNNRIQLLFGEEYGIRVSSIINLGTDVEITLPLITQDDGIN